MNDIKVLIDMISELPQLGIWILGIYFFYKLAIIGSWLGAFRFAISSAQDAYKSKKQLAFNEAELELKKIEKASCFTRLNECCINDSVKLKIDATLSDYFSKSSHGSSYIHLSDVDRLIKALNAKNAKE